CSFVRNAAATKQTHLPAYVSSCRWGIPSSGHSQQNHQAVRLLVRPYCTTADRPTHHNYGEKCLWQYHLSAPPLFCGRNRQHLLIEDANGIEHSSVIISLSAQWSGKPVNVLLLLYRIADWFSSRRN